MNKFLAAAYGQIGVGSAQGEEGVAHADILADGGLARVRRESRSTGMAADGDEDVDCG